MQVLAQFRVMYENRSNMEEIYVMGHRLIIFLEDVLPQHPHFASRQQAISFRRSKSRHDLDWIHKRLDVVALRIDEAQLNKFVLNDLALQNNPGIASTEQEQEEEYCNRTTTTATTTTRRNHQQSSRPARSVHLGDSLECSNHSSSSSHPEVDVSFDTIDDEHDHLPSPPPRVPSTNDKNKRWEDFSGWNGQLAVERHSHNWTTTNNNSTDTMKPSTNHAPVFSERQQLPNDDVPTGFVSEESSHSILHRIASEDVTYETDSEANDSWAQGSDNEDCPVDQSNETLLPELVAVSEASSSASGSSNSSLLSYLQECNDQEEQEKAKDNQNRTVALDSRRLFGRRENNDASVSPKPTPPPQRTLHARAKMRLRWYFGQVHKINNNNNADSKSNNQGE